MTLNAIFEAVKFGDTIEIESANVMAGTKSRRYKVGRKTKLRKGTIEKISLTNIMNPKGVKSYLYKRNGKVSMAVGDMAASVKSARIV